MGRGVEEPRRRCEGYRYDKQRECRRKAVTVDWDHKALCDKCATEEAKNLLKQMVGPAGLWAIRYLTK